MSSPVPSHEDVLEVFDGLAPAGAPLTTAEVADAVDRADGPVRERLTALAEDGAVETRAVGASGRVWWRSPDAHARDERSDATPAGLTVGQLLESVPGRYLVVEPEHYDIVAASDAYLDATMTERADIVGRPLFEVFPESEDEAGGVRRLRASLERVVDEGSADVMAVTHYPIPDPESDDGFEDRWWTPTNFPVFGPTGDVDYVVHRVEDVTPIVERLETDGEDVRRVFEEEDLDLAADIILLGQELRRTQERTYDRLRESERLYQNLFESMSEGFCVLERVDTPPGDPADYRYVETNPAFEGHSRFSDVVGKTVRELIPDGDREWVDIFDDVLRTGESERFEREIASEGRIQELYPFRVGDGSSRRVGVVFRDITDRKRRVRALEDAHNQLQAATSAGSVGLWTWDVREDTVTADEYVATSHGLDPATVAAGAPLDAFFDPVHPADRERVCEHVERTLAEGGRIDTEYRVRNADGDAMWVVTRGAVDYGEDGEPSQVYGAVSDITERKRREEREQFLAELAGTLQPLSDPVEMQDEASRVLAEHLGATHARYVGFDGGGERAATECRWPVPDAPNAAGSGWLDVDSALADELRAGNTVVVSDARERPGEDRRAPNRVDVGARVTVPLVKEDHLVALLDVRDAEPREWTDGELALIAETAERTWDAVERAMAEEALRRANEGLERLNAASRELMRADTREIRDRVAELAGTVLGVEYAALWQYDETTGDLRRDGEYVDPGANTDAFRRHDVSERVWQVFVGDGIDVSRDLPVPESAPGDAPPLRSGVLVSVGRHGVVCAASVRSNAFDERTVDLAETLAATVETAWNRAESDRELSEQNEELQRVDRLNGLIRGIARSLVRADSREEIDRVVCERLAASDSYAFAWIGDRDEDAGAVRPREWAGVDGGYLDDLTDGTNGPSASNPVVDAVRTRETQVVADVVTDVGDARWRTATLERGARSCLSLPLVHDDVLYGVLTVYPDRPHAQETDRAVLEELAVVIAYAIDAAETKETFRTTTVVELALRTTESTTPLCRLARRAGCTVTFEGLVPEAAGDANVFFTASGRSSDDVREVGERTTGVEDLTCLDDRGTDALFRMRATDPTLASLFAEHEAVVRDLTVDAGDATAVVDLPHTVGARAFVERLRRSVSDLELRARRPRTRPLETRRTFRAVFEGELTPRQWEVLETAYRSGFFESPRTSTGQEVTALLDVSQPTFSEHLRAAERTLCELLFDDRARGEVPHY